MLAPRPNIWLMYYTPAPGRASEELDDGVPEAQDNCSNVANQRIRAITGPRDLPRRSTAWLNPTAQTDIESLR